MFSADFGISTAPPEAAFPGHQHHHPLVWQEHCRRRREMEDAMLRMTGEKSANEKAVLDLSSDKKVD